jgi:hypothetical protein
MRKLLFLLILGGCSTMGFSQNSEFQECGTDEVMKKHYENFPQEKIRQDIVNQQLSQIIKSGKSASTLNTTQVYEIPIVVHVVGDGSAVGTPGNKSDADIIAWINYTNGIFSGSSSSGMHNTSAPLPVRLVFAKIDPQCNSTNGINRINASHLPKYVNNGVSTGNSSTAASMSDITALGLWNTSKYYNIYVVKNLVGYNGYAYLPGSSIDYTFMSANASAVNAQTLAHEFGHALGLRHTFQGNCMVNNDCTSDGDLVCDTEPIQNLLGSCPTGQINPCTNQLYAGGERNIMSYTKCFRDLFTQGQSERATAQLLYYRQSLINSQVAATTSFDNNTTLVNSCTPVSIINPEGNDVGITHVKFGSINNYSNYYIKANQNFYENFTGTYCLSNTRTSIPQNAATTISVSPGFGPGHIIKAYIDYNNDGQFNETTELILNQDNVSYGSPATASVTPPSDAVLNTPLRMRIIGEASGTLVTACYTPTVGQIEDYSVTIDSSLSVNDAPGKRNSFIIKTENSIHIKSDSAISSIQIYDASGRLLTGKTNINSQEIKIPFDQKNLIITVKVVHKDGKIITKKVKG